MNRQRRKALMNNTITAAINQVVAIICAFILPRQMLLSYGSKTNGLVTSISQFLSFVGLLDMGVSTVVQSALYKPIAQNDILRRDRILSASNRFFKRIAFFLLVYTVVLMLVYPIYVRTNLDYITTALLIFAISFSSISEYLFGITNQVLLNADQKAYVQFGLRISTTLINTTACIILMRFETGIVIVKLVSAVIFFLRPLGMKFYVDKYYGINRKEHYDVDPIEQKWNGLAHHLSSFVFGNTDVVILTMFATLQDVSIYSVYLLVVSGLNRLYSVCLTGIGSMFGDLYARNEEEKLKQSFGMVEWISHNLVILMFGNTGLLLVDFVMVYTSKIADANYSQPLFSLLLTIAYGLCCLRNIYNILICSAGHFKQTQASSIIEAVINVAVSLVLVKRYGLVGVAIGTLIAVLYQQIYYFYYLHNNIVFESIKCIVKLLCFDAFAVAIIVTIGILLHSEVNSYSTFFIELLKLGIISSGTILLLNFVFFREKLASVIDFVKGRGSKG